MFCVMALATTFASAQAQSEFDYDDLRTKSFSIYGTAGLSTAMGVDFENVNPSAGTGVAALYGGGININLRPWVRLGLNYEYSSFSREQNYSSFQPVDASAGISGSLYESSGGLAYRKKWNAYNNVDLTAEFNVMEIFDRESKWFNLYVGAGVGFSASYGNTYSIIATSETWDNMSSTSTGSTGSYTVISKVKTPNEHNIYNAPYVPAVLAVEFDVSPKFTLGLRGSAKFLFTNDVEAPTALATAGIVLRYNFVGHRLGGYDRNKSRQKYIIYNGLNSITDALNGISDKLTDIENAVVEGNVERERNEQLTKSLQEVQSALDDCRTEADNRASMPNLTMSIYYDVNSARLSNSDMLRLDDLVAELAGSDYGIELVGEASSDGETGHNQRLSQRRVDGVVDYLKSRGIDSGRISSDAIGDSNQNPNPAARKVKIFINK